MANLSKRIPDVSAWLTYEERFIDPSLHSGLWFCENAEAVQVVGANAVSLPVGGQWNNLNQCRAFFSLFPCVVIVAANNSNRERMVEELQVRLNYMPLIVVPERNFKGCRTVTEFFEDFGLKAVEMLLAGAEELPCYGLLNLAEIQPVDMSSLTRTQSNIPELDRAIGGFYEGELSVWTGKRGEGKSTLLGQILLQAMDQGHTVCAYSGELPKAQFKHWVSVQAAGPHNLQEHTSKKTGKVYYTVPEHIQQRIDAWWDERFFLYDLGIATAHDEDSILDIFTLAYRCHGCDVFLVDNIMTAHFKTGRDADFYRAQSNFTGRLVNFAKRYGVHVHLVAHPRKKQGKLEADDVGGSSDITNRADNVFGVERVPEKQVDQVGFSCGLTVMKNRDFGATDKLGLDFEPSSRRFYKSGTGTPDWRFGWDYAEQQEFTEVTEPTPFEARERTEPKAGEQPIPGGLVRYH